jgi:hypothetical protein
MHLLQDTAMPCTLPDDAAASTMTGFWTPWDLFVQVFHCSIIVRSEEYTIPKAICFDIVYPFGFVRTIVMRN